MTPVCSGPGSLRTSETSYLNEAFSFYSAIRQRSYYFQVNKEDRCVSTLGHTALSWRRREGAGGFQRRSPLQCAQCAVHQQGAGC